MNLHYEFRVKYFDSLYQGEMSAAEVQANNDRISSSAWKEPQQRGRLIPLQDTAIYMEVGYPGLLIGLGDPHASNHCDTKAPEIAMGFSLDHVTGLPVIPGSQVKGMLRSAFIQNTGYIAETLGWDGEKSRDWVIRLENEIFGTKHPKDPRQDCTMDEHGGRDAFLDAYPVIPSATKLVGMESITPHRSDHGSAYNRLSEPTPLHLLKVMPGTIMQFRFVLTDTVVAEGITVSAEQKKELFASIIEDLGAGAKTSVGFGAMHRVNESRSDFRYLERIDVPGGQTAPAPNRQQPQRSAPPAAQRPSAGRAVSEITRPSQIQPGTRLKGVCQKKDDKNSRTGRILLLKNPEVYGMAELKGQDVLKYKEGAQVIVRVVSIKDGIRVTIE